MITDPDAQLLWDLCKQFPNMGLPDQIRFVNAYAIVRLAKAVEGLSGLADVPQALRDASKVTLSTPQPLSVYTASVKPTGGTNL